MDVGQHDHDPRTLRQAVPGRRLSSSGKDMLFIAGGIGLAPLRSVINYCRHYPARLRKDRRSSTAPAVCRISSITRRSSNEWMPDDGRQCAPDNRPRAARVGQVTWALSRTTSRSSDLTPTRSAILCGPPIMIKFTPARVLWSSASKRTQVYTTLEMRMKCGIGKCGRCNIGSEICLQGRTRSSASTSSTNCPTSIDEVLRRNSQKWKIW